MKSEKQKDSGTVYEEANERLAQAIQNKNFNKAAIHLQLKGFLKLQKRRWKMQWTKANSVQIKELNWTRARRDCWRVTSNICLPRRERTITECEILVIVTKYSNNRMLNALMRSMLRFKVHKNLHEQQVEIDVKNFVQKNHFKKQNKYFNFVNNLYML